MPVVSFFRLKRTHLHLQYMRNRQSKPLIFRLESLRWHPNRWEQ